MNIHLRSQLRRSTSFLNKKGGRTKPTVSADYVVGLTDGEGCFFVNVWNTPTYRAGASVQLHFHIKLQATDKIVLDKVRNTLGCGTVYFQKEKRVNHSQCYRYSVYNRDEMINILIPFFRQHPLQGVSKSKSFELFCEVAKLIEAGMNKRTVGLA